MTSALPLSRQACPDTLFQGLRDAPAIVLAVSGGPDSMALLRLAARWRRDAGGTAPPVHVATVDHGLRPEAGAEALLVASAAAALGLPHEILVWRGGKPATRIQERARAARYGLLAAHARTLGASAIVTAHHADDQAETVLMRLGRGSGIGGLAGMARETRLAPGVTLVRPLLDLTKAELVDLCRRAGQTYVEDPSNDNAAFARARLRAVATPLAAIGLGTPGLTRFARRMARADAALEAEAARLEASLAPEFDDGRFRACVAGAREAEAEIWLRLLRRSIEHVVRDRPVIRLERLEALTEATWSALRDGRPHRATLGGARIVLTRDMMIEVAREPPRRRGRAVTAAATPTKDEPVPPSLGPNCRAY